MTSFWDEMHANKFGQKLRDEMQRKSDEVLGHYFFPLNYHFNIATNNQTNEKKSIGQTCRRKYGEQSR